MKQYNKIHTIVYLLISYFLAVANATAGEQYGSNPNVVNYPANRTWSITQDKQGILYFACSDEMLEFDGIHWLSYKSPNNRIVRTVEYDSVSQRIYCGSFEEFGYWKRNDFNEMEYYSISDSLPADILHNDDVWEIILGDTVIFHSFAKYFLYGNNRISYAEFPSSCLTIKRINNHLYAATVKGLYVFSDNEFRFIRNGEQFIDDKQISALLPFDEQNILIATQSSGLWLYDGQSLSRWKTEVDGFLSQNHLNRALAMRDSMFVFGTILSGVIAIDCHGRLLWHLHKSNGLQNNTVLGLHEDHEGNLWVALDNGIDYINIKSPLYFYRGNHDNVEAVYDICKYKGSLYMATNKGLFRSTEDNEHFKILPEIRGQVWSLSVWNNQLICGHNKGTARIEGDKVIPVSDITGGYCIRRYNTKDGDVLIQSTYTHLVVYKQNKQGLWQMSHFIPNFIEPIRYIEIDHHGNIWAGHIEKNIFRIRLNQTFTDISDKRCYTSVGNNKSSRTGVFKVNNHIVFTTGNSLFTYDDINDSIVPYERLNKMVGKFAAAHKIISTDDKHYWFCCNDELACFVFENTDTCRMLQRISHKLLKNQIMLDNECILTNNNRYSFIGLINGFAILDSEYKSSSTPKADILLRKIDATTQKQQSLKLDPKIPKNVLPSAYCNVKFVFAYPSFCSTNVQLFYKLEGLEKIWSPVAENYEKEYSRIPAGNYRFIVKAVDNNGDEISQTSYNFVISPPWYASKVAIIGYVVFGILLLVFSYKIGEFRLHLRHQKAMQAGEKRRQEELAQKEQKIIRLKNEKLESEVLFKAKELASSAMAIIQKNNVLQTLKQELQKENSDKSMKNIVKLINKNLSSQKEWEMFEVNFDLIHDSFFRNLKKRSPQLTSHDLKLCAYLRLNLSTKEIAQLTGNSIRGVEVARYRLRKKLQLSTEQNLNLFMLEFK